jgi:VCBS repeat protein
MHFSAPVHYAFYNPEGSDPAGSYEDQGDPSLIADYNQDGNLDLAMPGVNGIYITYGRSDGTFDALPVIRSRVTTGNNVVADFNEDGTPDLFTSGTTGLQLSLGKGNGTFASPVTVYTSARSPQAYLDSFAMLYSGDFNGDHHTDVVALQSSESENIVPLLFLGRGDGTFHDPASVTNVTPGFPYGIADVNGDGRDDLVYITGGAAPLTGVLNVLLSQGDGAFDLITTALPLVATTMAAFQLSRISMAMARWTPLLLVRRQFRFCWDMAMEALTQHCRRCRCHPSTTNSTGAAERLLRAISTTTVMLILRSCATHLAPLKVLRHSSSMTEKAMGRFRRP